MDTTREQLKTLNSQFTFFMKQKVAAKTNLISLLDNTYPVVNKFFDSPTRDDGSKSGLIMPILFGMLIVSAKSG